MKDITDTVRVLAKPLPFKDEVLEANIAPGLSLREILGNDSDNYIINLNGENIPSSEWSLTFVCKDDLVLLHRLPKGDGRDVLRIILAIVVIAFSVWSGGVLGGIGASGFLGGSAAFWSSALMFVGMVAIGLLLPPILPLIDNSERKRLNSITGIRNSFAPFAVIPNLYGKHKLYPPIASLPFTEVIGEDQYLNMIFCIGLGNYTILGSDVKIGDTLATDYEDIDITITDQPNQQDIFELQQNLNLTQPTDNPGDTFTRASAADTESISLDFVLPGGLIQIDPDDGDKHFVRIHFSVEFRISGSSDPWVFLTATNWNIATHGLIDVLGDPGSNFPAAFTSSAGAIRVSTFDTNWLMVGARTRDPFRVGVRWNTGSAGTWDVRVTRQRSQLDTRGFRSELDSTWEEFSAIFFWTALRSYKPVLAVQLPANTATFMVLRVRATDQLNGTIDSLNVIATRELRSWNKGTQLFNAEAATRDPAWAYLDILTGLGNARPIVAPEIDKIILDDLFDWAADNATNGFFYDEVIDYSTSVFDALTKVSGVGRAAISNRDGKWTIILEQAGGSPVQYFTPRNSRNFSSTKRFVSFPHAFRVRFNSDQDDYQETELIVYDDGFDAGSATEFEVLALSGITDPDQAWKVARYTMAAIKLRPEIITFDADIEHIIAQRGDHILASHDIPLWGTVYGRILSISGNDVTLDEEAIIDGGTSYTMRVRLDTGLSVIENLVVQSGLKVVTHTFTPSIPAGVKVGDLVMVGVVGSETQELVLISVEPTQDLGARLTCVEHNDGILTADQGAIPPYNPNITLPSDPTTVTPSPPFNLRANSDQNSFITDGSSTIRQRITVAWDLESNITDKWPVLLADLRWREFDATLSGGTWNYIPTFNAFQAYISINDVDIDHEYEIEMRTVTQWDIPSVWSAPIFHTVGGATRLPPAVDSIATTGVAGGIILDVDVTSVLTRTGSYLEISYGIVNDRLDVGTTITQFVIPADLTIQTVLDFFIPIFTPIENFFWVRLVDIYSQFSIFEPVSDTAGVPGTPLQAEASIFYIKPLNGTAIHGGVGTLTIEAHLITGGADVLLSSGTIQLFDPGNNIVNVANGYVTGSDGYTGILDSGDISNDIIITLKDGAGGTPLDTISLVDIADGAPGGAGDDSVSGFIEPENGLAWRRDGVDGDWTPSQLTTDLDVTFVQGGASVARQGYRITLDPIDGTLTSATTPHPLTDLNVGRITITPNGVGSEALSVTFAYSFSGDLASVTETVISVTGGGTGLPGQFTSLVYDDLDTIQLAAGQSRYAMLTDVTDNTTGSQNNFHLTDAILINKKSKVGVNFRLLLSEIREGDRIVYRISNTRWFIFVVSDTEFEVVGSGSAEAYKFDVTLLESLDPNPTVNISTSPGTDVTFEIHKSLFDTAQQVIIDPDFDLSSGITGPITNASNFDVISFPGHLNFWAFDSATQDQPSSAFPSPIADVEFISGGGVNNSNALKVTGGLIAGGVPNLPYLDKVSLWHVHRFRTNTPAFDIKIRWRNQGANSFTPSAFRMWGFDGPRGGLIVDEIFFVLGAFAPTGSTWEDLIIHLEGDGTTTSQYWQFAWTYSRTTGSGGFTAPDDEIELEFDSIFVTPSTDSYGTNIIATTVFEGVVPKSDTVSDAGKFLRADGIWEDPPGGSAPITSVFTRTGAIVALTGDYSAFYTSPGDVEIITALWHFHAGIHLDDNDEIQFGSLAGGDIQIDWDGTDLEVRAATSGRMINLRDAMRLRWYDSSNIDTFTIHHDGTDVILTSGLAAWYHFGLGATGFTGIKLDGALSFLETANAPTPDILTRGVFWVRNDNPNTPMYTDDLGNDSVLNAAGVNISGTPVNNQLAIWTGEDTIEGSPELTWDDTGLTIDEAGVGANAGLKLTGGVSGGVGIMMLQVGGAADENRWNIDAAGGAFTMRPVSDAISNGAAFFFANRIGNTVDDLQLITTVQIGLDTLTVICSGDITATNFNAVPLTAVGVATNYLDETGNYSVPATGSSVTSVFTRTGAVVALTGDYAAFYTRPGDVEVITALWHFHAGIHLDDNDEIQFGTLVGGDARMFFDAADLRLQLTGASNQFIIQLNGTELSAVFNPNGSVDLYHNNLLRLSAAAGGKAIIRSDANTETEGRLLEFQYQNALRRGMIGYETDAVLRIRNETHSGDIELTAEDGGGVPRRILLGDPDAITTLRGDTDIRLETGAGTDLALICRLNSSVGLFFNNVEKLTTTSTGVDISGALILDTPLDELEGGTGQSSFITGQLLYASATNVLAKRAIGSTNQVLTVIGGVPTWATPSTGVTTVFGRSGAVVALTGDYSAFYTRPGDAEIITGLWHFHAGIHLNDLDELQLGSAVGGDAQLYFQNLAGVFLDLAPGSEFELRGGGALDRMIVATADGDVALFFNGVEEFRTQNSNGTDRITGAEIKHWDGSFYDVGMARMPKVNFTGNLTVTDTHWHKRLVHNGSGSLNVVLNTETTQPQDVVLWVLAKNGTVVLTGTMAKHLYDGAGAIPKTGNITIARAGWATVVKDADGVVHVTGVGLTS